ncbi:MAG: ribosomal RNA small subunit methyltransferase E [Acidimicrobiales bacterium]|nr:MAG: ribosomal RNA small subunit methyltransferase E [Acidimicrobiales bacterium]
MLRLRDGDSLTVGDGLGRWRPARFGSDLRIDGEVVEVPAASRTVAVGFALIKGGRPELVVQKLTELGVDRILPLAAERSVVRWDEAKVASQYERMVRVAREAGMQSRRARLPEVAPVAPVESLLNAAMADPGGEVLDADVDVLLVGPEGGWTPEELRERRRINLGSTILRAETAAIVAGVLLVALRDGRVVEAGRD